MIDSHCHLDLSPLYEKLNEVINRAQLVGVKFFLTISTSLKSFETVKTIISKYENIYGTLGIHPHEAKDHVNVDKKKLLELKGRNNKIIGIGETGLDFYYNHSDKKKQKKSFVEHISAASQLNIPIIVHSRNAEIDTYDILKNENKNLNLKVLMHCFTGSKDFAKKLIDQNFYISVSGIITFKKSNELINTISTIPIENLLIETDSPYLAPSPNRGKDNEPSYIIHIVKKLSQIKNLTKSSLSKKTTNNFMKLFNLV
jgi:TatD DNase family protein